MEGYFMEKKKIRLAVLGTGPRWMSLIDIYTQNPHVEVVAVCDFAEGLAEEAAAEQQKVTGTAPKVFKSYEEMAKNESVIREEVYRKKVWDYSCQIACKKYKRPAKIEEYTKKLYDETMASHKLYVGEFSYADFKLTPSISSGCCLTIDRLLISADTCYEYAKNDKYFSKVKGWSIVYITRYNEITDGVHSLASSFRPYFKFIMDEEASKMLNEENRKLVEDVTSFYEGCTYWGD